MAFTFGDLVRVSSCERLPGAVGKVGTVIGIGDDEGDGLSYAVALAGEATASFWESEVQHPADPFAPPAKMGA